MKFSVYQVQFKFAGMDGTLTQNVEVKQGADLIKQIQKQNGTKRKIELLKKSFIYEGIAA